MQGEYKKATEVLEKAGEPRTRTIPKSRSGWDAHSDAAPKPPAPSPLRATPRRRASGSKKSVELNPKNTEALSDLFEYYLEAPGFLGGGLDKAEAIAAQDGRARHRRRDTGRAPSWPRSARNSAAPRSSCAARSTPLRSASAAFIDLAQIPRQTGPVPGGRPEHREGREDRSETAQGGLTPRPICTSRTAGIWKLRRICSSNT